MPRIAVWSYKTGSVSARALAQALDVKVIKRENSKYVGAPDKYVINWGDSAYTEQTGPSFVLNDPASVERASRKDYCFDYLRENGVSTPQWTTVIDTARHWYNSGILVVAREQLQGHSGQGITLMNRHLGIDFLDAPLYTIYVKKQYEYRIHYCRVATGRHMPIAIQRKARDMNVPDGSVNWQIRTHDNGFVFVRQDLDVDPSVLNQARMAMRALDLDFGAVDVIWNHHQQKAFVLEVNTAPGLEGQTINDYAGALRQYVEYLHERR